ncbi:MAG: universal stress protein [Kofleriaceae bacterium]
MAMVTRILVATDLTQIGDAAIRVAVARAGATGARIAVCHVVTPGHSQPPIVDVVKQITAHLDRELGPAARDIEVMVRTGNPADQIASCAADWNADLVIVGGVDHPLGLLRRLFHTSVVDKVVRRAPCSVLVTRRAPATRRMLVGIDLDHSEDVLANAAAEQARSPCDVMVVHVVQPLPPLASLEGTLPVPRWDNLVANVLPNVEAMVAASGLNADVRVVPGDPGSVLCDLANELSSEMVIVGTHGRKGIARVALGSVAEKVASEAPCPVLVVPL